MSNQIENLLHWRELWDFVASINDPVLSTKLVADIYHTGKNIFAGHDEIKGTDLYYALCWCSCDLAIKLQQKLPDHLHARMVLGEQNEKTKKYIKWCEKNDRESTKRQSVQNS